MSKPGLFITRGDYPCVIEDMLKDKFDVSFWRGSKIISKKELIRNIKGKFGLVCFTENIIDKDVVEAAGKDLKVVATFSEGYDHLDVQALKSHGVKVGYTGGIPSMTETVAEFAVGLALARARRIVESNEAILRGEWSRENWSPMWMCGNGIYESDVGILGCGRIGLSIMEKIKPFRPNCIHYFSRSEKSEAKKLGAEFKPLDNVMRESDFIFVSLSLNAETKGIINKEKITMMRPSAIIINIGRGALIDQKALKESLKRKRIAGAALDVFETEPLSKRDSLAKMEHVVVTPHISGATCKNQKEMGKRVAENILAVLNNQKMPSEL